MDSVEQSTKDEAEIDYLQLLRDNFPYYLSLGMTYDQYWNADPYLTRYYRKAHEMKFEQENQMMWIQGMYICDAINTVVYNVWCRGEHGKIRNYAEKPYEFNVQKSQEERVEEAQAQAEVWMSNLVNSYK